MRAITELQAENRERSTKHRRGWRITSRDLDILVAVYRFRFLTRQLVEWAFFSREDGDFDRRSSLAARRLQVLFEAGYAQRLIVPVLPGTGRSPAVYALSSRGADAVAAHLGVDREEVDWTPKHNRATAFFMEHTLGIARLWASLEAALLDTDLRLANWMNEAQLRQWDRRVFDRGVHRWVPVRPDGYFRLWRGRICSLPCFVEVDMGTETNGRFAQKVRAYQVYRREEGRGRSGIGDFRLLVVTSGARRLENLRRVSSRAVDQDFCLFATLDDLHPSRVLGSWLEIDRTRVDLIGLIPGRQDGEDPEDDEEEKPEEFGEDGQFDSDQVDDDGEDEDDDDDHVGWYDDEDPETWGE